MLRDAIEIAAEPDALFELTRDYARRLDGASRPGVGVRASCVARNGLGMETRHVSFNPLSACAVEMTRGPWFLRNFAGS